MRSVRSRSLFWMTLSLALLVLAIGGCGKNTSLVLQAALSLASTSPSLTKGDGTANDGWGDQFLPPTTPTGFAMGIRSAKLTGPSSASYTIFDNGANGAPSFFRLSDNATTTLFNNSHSLASATYDHLALQVAYYEAAIPIYNGATPHTRRLRSYLANFTEMSPFPILAVNANDLLMSADDFTLPPAGSADVGSDGIQLWWIQPDDGSLCTSITLRANCHGSPTSLTPYPTNPYQVQPTLAFPGYDNTGTINIPLPSSITVDSSTDAQFVITLNVGAYNLFFYDETDAVVADIGHFNFLSPLPPATPGSDDGKILAACTTSPSCPSPETKGIADFWVGAPTIDITVSQ